MATQFDPIAKDESLNTTEVTPRNIADVLAQGLDAIEQAIAGAGIDASDVTYGGGTVEDALDGLAYESEVLQVGVTIKRLGKLRVLYIGGSFAVSVGTISITALPSKDRPSQNILGEVGTAILSGKNYPFSINLKTDGTMTGFALDVTQTDGYRYLTGSPQIYATFTYAVN